MKVAELRAKLAKMKKEEITKLAVEFYKLVPKAKKEDYGLDNLINNPNEKKQTANAKSQLGLADMEAEIKQFLEHARAQYYLAPNRIVPKKERSKWRFKVKRWYKELTNRKREDFNLAKQSELLLELYELISEACGYEYFSAYDPFQSIGITQSEFFRATISLMQEAEGKNETLKKGINLIMDNYLSRESLYSFMMREFIATLSVPALREKGIEIVKSLIIQNGFTPPKDKKNRWFSSNSEFLKEEKHNNLTEFGFRLYVSLHETEEGIKFYQANHYSLREEVKLYILVSLLFEERKKKEIKTVIEQGIKNGIEPRDKLLIMLKGINENDQLPQYM
jgi:hypothetical protein